MGTDWLAIFIEAQRALNARPVYHGLRTVDGDQCLWVAVSAAYYDITGEHTDDDDDLPVAIRILRMAIGMDAGTDLFPVFKWNDARSDEAVRAAIARAVELVS